MHTQELTNRQLLERIDRYTRARRELREFADLPGVGGPLALECLEFSAALRNDLKRLHAEHCLRIGLGKMERCPR